MNHIEVKGRGCSVKIVADSISEAGKRIVTPQLRYWRPIHSELMTHRVFSRNASSSRAIPVAKMIEQVKTDPAMPIYWGKNQAGMSAREELTGRDLTLAMNDWLNARNSAVEHAERLVQCGAHKQIVNRLLEPWQYISVIVTATEWENFFELRCHPDAQPEIQDLAETIRKAMALSTPRLLKAGEWHLPYVTDDDWEYLVDRFGEDVEVQIEYARKISAARCARVSYLLHDGTVPSIDKDLDLYEKLVGSRPLHASPVEHQATPDEIVDGDWVAPMLHGNFVGWIQNRKLVERQFA